MYWDVIEVKTEPDHKLFVRFKDGLSGHIQLQPGEIDSAPDALYTEVRQAS